jgi:hypothetical protein
MKIGLPDDYQDAVRTLDCFQKLNGHQVSISREHASDPEALAAHLQEAVGPAHALFPLCPICLDNMVDNHTKIQ